ncbi:Methyltransferase domain-containing protein [Singulisphaera sp. GP187]|uniref:class I SAM-dependent methyltransferase n=1 Tax=Singulisphaera sp. GP187 TaxID=1882752 RepID=UPI00092B49F8|nr:class I SAM-dependent methyltransferase [Singulisphaera sp. GP187]SIO57556.1 Methyltransferase domain-containing protein [Singulisphaera sp. GP187]
MAYDRDQATHEFTRWSESYDRSILQWLLFGPSHRALIRRIRTVVEDRPARILDVGCGTGVFASRIRESLPNAKVWGIDLVAEMLTKGTERWRQHAGHIQPAQADSERLPFASGTFDIVTCANSFHHYPHQDRAIAEMHRVLRPGGRLMLIDGYRDGLWGWFIYDVCVAGVEGDVHHASSKRFRELFAQAGLRAIAQKVHRGPAPFLLTEAVATDPAPSSIFPSPHFRGIAGIGSRDTSTSASAIPHEG